METYKKQARDIREGSYVIIDDMLCQVDDYTSLQSSRRGHPTIRIESTEVFSDNKHIISKLADSEVVVPVIEEREGQVVNVKENEIQVMDLETYETFLFKPEKHEVMDFEQNEIIDFIQFEQKRSLETV